MRGPGSIPTGSHILSLDFFHIVKPLMPILALLQILFICEKPESDAGFLVMSHSPPFASTLSSSSQR